MIQMVEEKNEPGDEEAAEVNEISTIRRLMPQIIVTVIGNLIIFNKGMFNGFPSIAIPPLLGISNAQNPNETIRITADQSSWLSSVSQIGHPLGSLLSGFISDALGRRRAMILVMSPAVLAFIILGYAESFTVVCLGFVSLSFIFGLKDAPTSIYVSEISEPSFRGTLLAFAPVAANFGKLFVYVLSIYFSWRQVAFISVAVPVVIVTAICFIPESPHWLLLKDRSKDAQKSLQWLRGWVSSETVRTEFQRLQSHSVISNACVSCAKQSIRCYHPKATFYDKVKELKLKRTLKPLILVTCLNSFYETCNIMVWRPYSIQVIKAYGMPLDADITRVILSVISFVASGCFLFNVKTFGKRKMYLYSTAVAVICAFGLSIYGFVFFPPNWTSFINSSDSTIPNFDLIRDKVGNYGYFALILLFVMEFVSDLGLYGVPYSVQAEVFSFRSRSFLCGISMAIRYFVASIATKTYYNIELLLSLNGATLFYGVISFIGLATMYFILPETENRSLEDIEIHYSDNTKKITDINISMNSKNTTAIE